MTRTPLKSGLARTLVVVPAFNEAESVGAVVTRLVVCGFDVIVVDDGSTDETSGVAGDAGRGSFASRPTSGLVARCVAGFGTPSSTATSASSNATPTASTIPD